MKVTLARFSIAAIFTMAAAVPLASGQTRGPARIEIASIASTDQIVQVRYPKSLLVCSHRDGENPDVWSPEGCAADLPVCDNSEHAGNVLICLAYPPDEFRGSELQAAAFSVSRIENFNASECVQRWARHDTSEIHGEQIGGLKFQVAKAREEANGHAADENIYRIFHKGACYELDVTIAIALDSAFAAEDVPRKLKADERKKITGALLRAMRGFRFLK